MDAGGASWSFVDGILTPITWNFVLYFKGTRVVSNVENYFARVMNFGSNSLYYFGRFPKTSGSGTIPGLLPSFVLTTLTTINGRT